MLVHLDYIWIDGLEHPRIRSKTKVVNFQPRDKDQSNLTLDEWNFDGSSTNQATTDDSERMLKPARTYRLADNHFAVMCEVNFPNGSPHPTNYRANLKTLLSPEVAEKEVWVGFEQELFLTDGGRNIFWPSSGEPIKDGRYYCTSGGTVKYRKLIREHAAFCASAGINIVGYNAEVTPGQWEYQCFANEPLKAADDLWMSRYFLELMCEDLSLGVEWQPKPHAGWNGSGCHTNFSTKAMRESGDHLIFDNILSTMEKYHHESLLAYGADNALRLTGGFETADYSQFTSGVASRGTSVRIPAAVVEAGWKGYLEDRRPSSGCDPYRVMAQVCRYVL